MKKFSYQILAEKLPRWTHFSAKKTNETRCIFHLPSFIYFWRWRSCYQCWSCRKSLTSSFRKKTLDCSTTVFKVWPLGLREQGATRTFCFPTGCQKELMQLYNSFQVPHHVCEHIPKLWNIFPSPPLSKFRANVKMIWRLESGYVSRCFVKSTLLSRPAMHLCKKSSLSHNEPWKEPKRRLNQRSANTVTLDS